ncbi:uncharacterized protein LOC143282564 [Babylonia areolata]|uniref:uncharacterized protein LOC143282564 n=1 Tax=Babylonia areolata TaxID=304850 RepID=UPI003FD3AB84
MAWFLTMTYAANEDAGIDRTLEGPVQSINLTRGHHYVFEGYAKLLNDVPGKIWQTFKVVVQINLVGIEKKQSYIIAYRAFCRVENGWIRLKGSIDAPMLEPSSAELSIRGPGLGVSFLLDNVTLHEVPENPNWMAEAHTNIEAHRKSNVNFRLILPPGLSKKALTLEISLKKHLFAFGAKIEEYELVEEPRNLYTDLVYNLFNWATVQAYKWKFNLGGRFDPDFSRATNATRVLRENGLKVRGHSILWDMKKNVPLWVQKLPVEELYAELFRHVHYMMTLTNGTLEQFDVQNEHIHGHYYEERLQNPNVTKDVFRQTRRLAPHGPDLYLNDFTCVTSGASTEDLYDLGMQYLREGVPIDGLGIQGHTKDFVKPDPTAMWRRLDRLAETGLDLMMTEFDIGWHDEVERADWLEDSIRAFFGHPALKGVILWGFWNGSMRYPDHELVTGPSANNLTILEPGERWACLTQKEWTTKVTRKMRNSALNFDIRGFQGEYEVIVRNRGVAVQRETFTLGKEDTKVKIRITNSREPIEIPEEVDYVPQCISHRAERTLGWSNTSSSNAALSCRTVTSSPSGRRVNDAVSVTCDSQEVMTSCSSYRKKWRRNGERVEMNADGRPQCTAFNGRNSRQGVVAQARCCQMTGLRCSYRAAGPSFPFDGAKAEARCAPGDLALGCSVHQPFPDSDGVKPGPDLGSCVAQSGPPASDCPERRSGAHVFSSCCRATVALNCQTKRSRRTGRKERDHQWVTCPTDHTMTGCNAFGELGRTAGVVISGQGELTRCRVTQGHTLPKNSRGARAYATCCRPENTVLSRTP